MGFNAYRAQTIIFPFLVQFVSSNFRARVTQENHKTRSHFQFSNIQYLQLHLLDNNLHDRIIAIKYDIEKETEKKEYNTIEL